MCLRVLCTNYDEAILNDLIEFEDEVDDDGCPVGLTKAQCDALVIDESDLVTYGWTDDALEKILKKLLDNSVFDWVVSKIPSDRVQEYIRNFVKNHRDTIISVIKGGAKTAIWSLIKKLAMSMIFG